MRKKRRDLQGRMPAIDRIDSWALRGRAGGRSRLAKASKYSPSDPSAPQNLDVRLEKVKTPKSALHEATYGHHELLRRHADLTLCSRAKVRQAPLQQPCRLCHLGITKAFEIDRSVIGSCAEAGVSPSYRPVLCHTQPMQMHHATIANS
jgi:hypothetical protein